MRNIVKIVWKKYLKDIEELTKQIKNSKEKYDCILGVSKGGNIPSTIIASKLNIGLSIISVSSYKDKIQEEINIDKNISNWMVFKESKKILLVDDLIDSGETIDKLLKSLHKEIDIAVIYNKNTKYKPRFCIKKIKKEKWVKFPYE